MEWDKLAIVDVETTGLNPRHDRVIEIGIALIDHNKLTATYSQLINPQTYLPPEITRLTGITNGSLESQPSFVDLADTIFAHLQDRLFVAHNVRFDYSFLKHEFRRLNTTLSLRHFCSARLSRRLFPHYRHHSLDSLIERFHLTVPDRHRALGDALAIWDFFVELPHQIDTVVIETTINRFVKIPALPPNLNPKLLDSLPNTPGVYIFYDAEHHPLYVGKSIHLKDRILDHFSSDLDHVAELNLKNQLADLEVFPAAGELEALLMEADLVKKLQPLFNHQLRRHTEHIGIHLTPNQSGYLIVYLKPIDPHQVDPANLYGVFKSTRQAKTTLKTLVKDHGLCYRLTGLETGPGACFNYHLGFCRGACMGKEKPVAYNLRVIEAFAPHKLPAWPFPGPITITEHNEINGRTAIHHFDQWCYLGTSHTHSHASFNLDHYHILRRYLASHPHAPHLISSSKYFDV
jgi:DNA polymerase III subunit epsilon